MELWADKITRGNSRPTSSLDARRQFYLFMRRDVS